MANALLSVVTPGGRDRGIEIALELLRAGEWDYAVDVAAAALDYRVHQLLSKKGTSAVTPTSLTELVAQLNDVNPVTLPSGMSVEALALIAIDAMTPSFDPGPMTTLVLNELGAEAFLKDVAAFLRANPLHVDSQAAE